MESLIDTEFTTDKIDTYLNESIHGFKSFNLTSSKINDISIGSVILKEKNIEDSVSFLYIHPRQWSLDDVLEWLKKEELNPGEVVTSFRKNNIDGETLLSLTHQDIKNELDIPTLKYRKRLYESIEKLKIKNNNSDVKAIASTINEEIKTIIKNSTNAQEVESFKIQSQLISQSINEINDFNYASKLDNEFKKSYDIEESDLLIAKDLEKKLNKKEVNSTKILIPEKQVSQVIKKDTSILENKLIQTNNDSIVFSSFAQNSSYSIA